MYDMCPNIYIYIRNSISLRIINLPSITKRLEPSHGGDLGGRGQAVGHVREFDLAAGRQKSWRWEFLRRPRVGCVGKKRAGIFHQNISEIFRNGDEYIYIMNIIVSMKIV